jgi:hypothetical protein
MIGLVATVWLILQIITGFVSRFAKQSSKVNPAICILTRNIHLISSYVVVFLSKFNSL